MPVEISGGPFSRDDQQRLAEALVHAGAEPETAALAVLMTPCTVAVEGDEPEAAARLVAAGFSAHAVGGPPEAPAGLPAITGAPRRPRGLLLVVAALCVVIAGLVGVLVGRGIDPGPAPTPVTVAALPPGVRALPAEMLPEPSAEAPAQTGAWTTGEVSVPADAGSAAFPVAVRTGRHEGFDRIVFEFEGASLPATSVAFAPQSAFYCESDSEVGVEGSAALRVSFDSGVVDMNHSLRPGQNEGHPRLTTIRDYAAMCHTYMTDFPWLIGLSSKQPYRAQVLRAPLRFVLDVQHPS